MEKMLACFNQSSPKNAAARPALCGPVHPRDLGKQEKEEDLGFKGV